MKRAELAHILRAACDITHDPNILVIGSQAILGSFPEERLPDDVIGSIEADVAFFDDADDRKADLVDGGIGEASRFHETFGIYGQGVSVTTASVPEGWQDRLVRFEDPEAAPSQALCLDPHDLVVAKLVVGREKDRVFARALLRARLIHAELLVARAQTLDEPPPTKRRVVELILALARSSG